MGLLFVNVLLLLLLLLLLIVIELSEGSRSFYLSSLHFDVLLLLLLSTSLQSIYLPLD